MAEITYLTLNQYYRQKYGCRVYKIPLDAGSSCPNRVSRNEGGCIYCSGSGSAAAIAAENSDDIAQQVQRNITYLKRRFKAQKFVAYFQAYTNTLGEPQKLQALWQNTLALSPDFVGLSIGTRPDCLNPLILNVLCQLRDAGYEIWIELGVQSLNDKSLNFIERGHDVACALNSLKILKQYNLKVCVHMIFGLPTETLDEAIDYVHQLGQLGIDGIKIHMLHIIAGTKLAQIYFDTPFELPTREQYALAVAKALQGLPPAVVVQRLTGDAAAHEILIAPKWSADKEATIQAIKHACSKLYK